MYSFPDCECHFVYECHYCDEELTDCECHYVNECHYCDEEFTDKISLSNHKETIHKAGKSDLKISKKRNNTKDPTIFKSEDRNEDVTEKKDLKTIKNNKEEVSDKENLKDIKKNPLFQRTYPLNVVFEIQNSQINNLLISI